MSKASELPHNESFEVEHLLQDMENGKVKHKLSPMYTRPLYYGTSLEMGGRYAALRKRINRHRDD